MEFESNLESIMENENPSIMQVNNNSSSSQSYLFSAPEYVINAELYVNNESYHEQANRQIFDFSRNSDFKRMLVHHDAENEGAWAYTTVTDRNIIVNPKLQYAPMSLRNEVNNFHEPGHTPSERETQYIIRERMNFMPKQNYDNVRPYS